MNRDGLIRVLTTYCERHVESMRGWTDNVGLTCDERGCGICNGDSAAKTAEWWVDEYLDGETDLPFDPDDPDEMADLLEDEADTPERDHDWERKRDIEDHISENIVPTVEFHITRGDT